MSEQSWTHGGGLDRELARIRRLQDEAAAGKTGEASIEAALRAALDDTIATMDPSLANFEQALGVALDPGSFLMGMQCAAFALTGTDAVQIAKLPLGRRLLLEYTTKARQR